jgi:hypothetical protein
MRVVRRPATFALGLAAVLFAVHAPAHAADEKAKPVPVTVDLSTPKKAAATFAKGIEANDKKAVRASSTGAEEDYALFEILASAVTANSDLQKAAVEKYGAEEAKKVGQPQESLAAKVDASQEKIDGDTATLTDGANGEDPMKLKKTADGWKIDLAQIPHREQIAQAKPLVTAMAKAMTDLAGEIRAGKHKTADEAQQAMGMKMIGALGAAGGAPAPVEPAPAEPKKDDAPAK